MSAMDPEILSSVSNIYFLCIEIGVHFTIFLCQKLFVIFTISIQHLLLFFTDIPLLNAFQSSNYPTNNN